MALILSRVKDSELLVRTPRSASHPFAPPDASARFAPVPSVRLLVPEPGRLSPYSSSEKGCGEGPAQLPGPRRSSFPGPTAQRLYDTVLATAGKGGHQPAGRGPGLSGSDARARDRARPRRTLLGQKSSLLGHGGVLNVQTSRPKSWEVSAASLQEEDGRSKGCPVYSQRWHRQGSPEEGS